MTPLGNSFRRGRISFYFWWRAQQRRFAAYMVTRRRSECRASLYRKHKCPRCTGGLKYLPEAPGCNEHKLCMPCGIVWEAPIGHDTGPTVSVITSHDRFGASQVHHGAT